MTNTNSLRDQDGLGIAYDHVRGAIRQVDEPPVNIIEGMQDKYVNWKTNEKNTTTVTGKLYTRSITKTLKKMRLRNNRKQRITYDPKIRTTNWLSKKVKRQELHEYCKN